MARVGQSELRQDAVIILVGTLAAPCQNGEARRRAEPAPWSDGAARKTTLSK